MRMLESSSEHVPEPVVGDAEFGSEHLLDEGREVGGSNHPIVVAEELVACRLVASLPWFVGKYLMEGFHCVSAALNVRASACFVRRPRRSDTVKCSS